MFATTGSVAHPKAKVATKQLGMKGKSKNTNVTRSVWRRITKNTKVRDLQPVKDAKGGSGVTGTTAHPKGEEGTIQMIGHPPLTKEEFISIVKASPQGIWLAGRNWETFEQGHLVPFTAWPFDPWGNPHSDDEIYRVPDHWLPDAATRCASREPFGHAAPAHRHVVLIGEFPADFEPKNKREQIFCRRAIHRAKYEWLRRRLSAQQQVAAEEPGA